MRTGRDGIMDKNANVKPIVKKANQDMWYMTPEQIDHLPVRVRNALDSCAMLMGLK